MGQSFLWFLFANDYRIYSTDLFYQQRNALDSHLKDERKSKALEFIASNRSTLSHIVYPAIRNTYIKLKSFYSITLICKWSSRTWKKFT